MDSDLSTHEAPSTLLFAVKNSKMTSVGLYFYINQFLKIWEIRIFFLD